MKQKAENDIKFFNTEPNIVFTTLKLLFLISQTTDIDRCVTFAISFYQ